MGNVDFVREELDAFVADPNRGHEDKAYSNPQFRQVLEQVLEQAIRRTAGR